MSTLSDIRAKFFGEREDPRVRLQQIFGGVVHEGGCPPTPAVEWAQAVFGSANGGPEGRLFETVTINPSSAIALLRTAEPRLTRRAATFLAQHVTHWCAHDPEDEPAATTVS